MGSSEDALRRCAKDTGQTVDLGVLIEDQVLYPAPIRNADLVTATSH
ncbi:hypothetical protein [Microbacterium sp. cf046]|nr:hypothetical protein [Microbacterium sp. cf046]